MALRPSTPTARKGAFRTSLPVAARGHNQSRDRKGAFAYSTKLHGQGTRLSRRPGRNAEGGFALLLVFLMASVIAISLYLEIPRVAMQTQRDREETLIDRGEQYKRAIQLFVKKTNRYPADIKDLENFQNQRFLRHRYTDPLTGKDEWRLVHINNGVLTDSKLTKPQGPGQDKPNAPNGFVTEMAGLGGSQGQNQNASGPNAKDRRRASEGGVTATDPNAPPGINPPGGNLPGGTYPGQPPLNGPAPYPGQPIAGMNGQPGYPPGMPGVPGQNGNNGQSGNLNNSGMGTTGSNSGSSGSSFAGGGGSTFIGGGGSFIGGGSVTGSQPSNPGQAGNPYPGGTSLPGQPGPPANSQNFGGTPAYPTQAGANGMPPGFPQPGTGTGASTAAAMIQNILTTPRPGGMPTGTMTGQAIGGGIAGVASTGEGEGVKVYNDRTLYQEWEFIYDPAKAKVIPNPNVAGAGGTPASQMPGATPEQTPGTLPAGLSPVGGTPPGSIMNNLLTPPRGQ